MSKRQRRRRQERRQQQRRTPSKGQLAKAGGITAGATLAFAGVAHAATFTVSNLNDSGPGSLRRAIHDANNNLNEPTADNVVFASGLSGTINVGSITGFGLYPETPMNVQGPGAGQITLRGTSGVDYVVFTGTGYTGSPGEPITISGLKITGGHSTGSVFTSDGGGIYNKDAALTVSGSVISGNHVDHFGGGIFSGSNAGSLTLVNSTVSGNTAGATPADTTGYGGGIYSDSPVLIRSSTISGNNSGGDGGGIYVSANGTDSSMTIENSTFANNTSTAHGTDDEGGGVWICCGDDGQHLDIKSSTITGNSVGGTLGAGGGVYAAPNTADQVTIRNTILANNHGTKGNDLFSTAGAQLAFSLIKDPANSTDSSHSLAFTGPSITGQDPQLGALANNGGPTQTEAVGPKSPVIDKGAAFGLTTDQRGVQRPIDFPGIPNAAGGDGSDIGAFELQPSNAITLGKLKRNKKRGTAKQTVSVPLPDAGTVTLYGKGLKTKTVPVTDTGTVKLPVIPKGKTKRKESRTGRVKIKAKITYTPTGGVAPNTLTKKAKLLKR